jgi:hypothetical protein
MTFDVSCPRCATVLSAGADLVGRTVGCRRCRALFRLDLRAVSAGDEVAARTEGDPALEAVGSRARVEPVGEAVRRCARGSVCCTAAAGLLGGILVIALLGSVLIPVWWAIHGRRDADVRRGPHYDDSRYIGIERRPAAGERPIPRRGATPAPVPQPDFENRSARPDTRVGDW